MRSSLSHLIYMKKPPFGGLRVKQAADRGATLIVANPRETKLDKFAKFVIRYAYGDEVKTIHDFSKKSKIADEFAESKECGRVLRQ
jgi:predicted molibdopterin-dependent oxidoreductase YjgC